MRICKRIDPVIDIVIIGFGKSSKCFVDIFLLNNELKGVNITIICKNTFVFLDTYVQCIELCKDTYIDIYKYCKERNILFINEEVESIDSDMKIIKFSSDRNHLCYDYLLCDFDYKSSYLLNNNDLSHMNIYTYKNKNLFFYYTHIIYLSLIKSQNNKITDKKEYMKWKTFFLKNIPLEKFFNFCSYNDKYVENIIDIYNFFHILLNNNMPYYDFKVVQEKVKILNVLKNKNPLIKEIVKNENYNYHISTNDKDETKEINNNSDNIFHLLILCDEKDYKFGKNLYYEIFENLHKISVSVKVIYVHIIKEEKYKLKDNINDKTTTTTTNNNNNNNNIYNNVTCSSFCSNFVKVREIKQVKKTEDKLFIEYIDMNDKLSTIFFDECINITNLKYPSYIYKSGYDIDNNKNINNFCQYYKDESLYFLNQITNCDTYTVCQNVYINIYNNIHKKEYISIDNIKEHISIYNSKQKHITIKHFSIYNIYELLINSYNKFIQIIKLNLIYIYKHPLTQNKVKPFLINKKYLIDNYLNEKKKNINTINKKKKSSSIDLFINLIMYIYNQFIYYIGHFENIIFHTKQVEHIININENSKTKIKCNVKNVGNTNQNAELLPPYMYDEYKKEYENRLIIKKKSSYKLIQNNNSIELYEDNNKNDNVNGTDNPFIIVEYNSLEKEPIIDTTNNKKVQSYIKESIDKIINRNTCGGCGSKVPSNVLSNSLKSLDIFNSPNVYLGVEGSDDCCIFVHSKSKTTEESPALVQTIDFFKSFIDDEYILGSIIAIHSLSDIYSMGGTGICALCVLIVKDNIERKLQQRLENVLTGCCQKLKEEKCVLSGGHTCAGNENYVGLAVTGKIKKRKDKKNQQQNGKKNIMNFRKIKNKPQTEQLINEDNINNIGSKEDENKINKETNSYIEKHQMLKENYLFLPKGNGNLKNGDVIITTKMFGFGFIMAAHIIKKAKARWIYSCLDEMLISNRKSGLYFLQNNVKACTDVTGFGILGHLNEMLKCSRKEIYLHHNKTNYKHNDILDETTKEGYSKKQDEQLKQKKNVNICDQNNNKLNMLGAKIKLNNIIIAEGVQECIENNIYSSMYKKNHYLCNNIINLDEAQLYSKYGILFDPQTSGGLMAIVEKEKANQILYDLKNMGYPNSSIIGEIINVQYEKFNNISIQDISLSDYLDTTDSIYVEL
ncbi:putative selenide water dikinase [Plasmodium gaboni]|uniref:Putative selenide water dikinase n=1 Tax=Plasmodium gaboni TaxID=647221 RepID=A0A151LLM2_9APIC|nr:putative selenide water dikinase [Plasmodium gaboni]KYO00094.1 putative selenide water dikinase [Plasmodium gaboni]